MLNFNVRGVKLLAQPIRNVRTFEMEKFASLTVVHEPGTRIGTA